MGHLNAESGCIRGPLSVVPVVPRTTSLTKSTSPDLRRLGRISTHYIEAAPGWCVKCSFLEDLPFLNCGRNNLKTECGDNSKHVERLS